MKIITKTIQLVLLLLSSSSFSQMMPHIGWFEETQLLYNPAYAGTSEEIRGAIISRTQWNGIDGAPRTNAITIDKHLGKSVGAGLDVTSDQIGSTYNLNFSLNGSYRVYLNANSYIQGGLKAGVSYVSSDFSSLEQWDDGDPLKVSQTVVVPKIGFGFMYIHKNFFVGASIPDFVAADTKGVLSDEGENKYLRKNYFFTVGTKFELTEFISVVPNAMVRYYSTRGTNFILNVGVELNQTILLGVSYVHPSVYGLYAKIGITPRLKVGYRHEISPTIVSVGSFGTGEFLLSYGF